MSDSGTFSREQLGHFRCKICNRWWTIADAPQPLDREWFCPWCGERQAFVDRSPKHLA